jgi:outer membrane scaffolding protein for murein synthesis (MipA/OmpV family)
MRRLALLVLLAPLCALADGDPTLIGAAVRTRPAYDGSRSQVTDVIPVISYYGKPWFVRSTEGVLEGGARLEVAKGAVVGAQVAYEVGPRSEDPSASLGAHVEIDGKVGPAPVTFLARLRERFARERETQVDLRLTVGLYQSGPASAGVYAQTTWSSAAWTQDYYRVRDSGILINDIGLLGGYDLGRRWVALGSVEFGRLGGGVAGSPFVQQRSTFYATAGLAYKF